MRCWITLVDTTAEDGTIKFARASYRWPLGKLAGEFHVPVDYRKIMLDTAARAGVEPDIHCIEVKAACSLACHPFNFVILPTEDFVSTI